MSDPLDALLSQPSAATGAAGADPYGALLGVDTTQQRFKSTLNLAVGVAPDQAAQQRKTAQQLGTPVAAVEALPEDAKRAAAVQTIDTNTAAAPVLRKKYTEGDFAKLAHDDSGVLAHLESLVGSLGSAARYVVSADDDKGLVNDIKAGLINTQANAWALGRAATELVAAPLLDFLEVGRSNALATGDWRGVQLAGGNPMRRLAEGFATIAEERTAAGKEAGSKMEGNFGQGVASGVQSLTQNLLMLPAALLTGGESVALTGMAAMAGGSSYEKAREAGLNPYSAALYGTTDAVVEFMTEKLPMHKLLGDLSAGTPFLKTLLHNAALEIPGEQIATILQDANEWATLHPEKSVRDYLSERPDAAVQTLIATIIGSGGQVTLLHAVQQAANNVNGRLQQVHEAEQFGASLEQMLAAAGTSKLRERAPDAFASTIQQMADETGGAPSAVYADARLLSETLAQSGMTLEQLGQSMPDTVASLREALAQNGTVTIPMGELMATTPGTPLEQALLPILRQSAEGLSQVEAKEAGQQADTFIKDQAGRVMEQAEQRSLHDQQTAEIKQTITEQLNAAKRFRPGANQVYGTMVGAFYSTMAQRMGVTPAELYAKYPLRVTGEMQAGALEQGGLHPRPGSLTVGSTTVEYATSKDGKRIEVAMVKTPPADRGQGNARAALEQLVAAADAQGAQVVLTAEPMDKVTSKTKLEAFYKSLGFKPNKGRAKDFTTMAGMVREPKGGALEQKTRATFSPEQMLIALGKNADYSSFLHESGHAFLEILNDLATQPDAPEQIAKDWQTTLDWFGVTPEAWAGMTLDEKRPYHERWAESTEQYFFEGKAPSVELRGVFDRFRTWLMSVYKSLSNFLAMRSATPGGRGTTLAQSAPGTAAFDKWFGNSKVVDAEGKPLVVYHGTNAHAYSPGESITTFNTRPASGRGGAFFTDSPNLASQYGERVYDTYLSMRNPLTVYADGKGWTTISGKSRVGGGITDKARQESERDAKKLTDVFAELADLFDEPTETVTAKAKLSADAADLEGKTLGDLPGLDGESLETDAVVKAARRLGYDGVIFKNVQDSPTTDAGYERTLSDVFAVFNPEQIKSATGNDGTFDADDPSILSQGDSAGPLGLSDEIRQVMDRLLATDEQITAAERVREYGLLFKSPEEAGMTPEQWAKYTSEDAKAHAEALTDLAKRNLRDMAIVTRKRMKALREVQADMAEKRKEVEKEAAAEIDATPIEKAKRALKEAAQPSDAYRAEAKAWAESRKQAAAQAEQDVKAELLAANPDVKGIEKGQLIAKSKRDMANEAERRVLQWENQNPKPRAPVADVDMAAIADAYGFTSVQELQRELVSGFSRKESIEGLTDRLMLERYGDLSQPRGMERAADEAVHNENRARVLAAEMAAVSQANNARAPTASGKTVNAMVAAAKQFAARLVESRKVKDLKPQLHTAAETRAARAAEKALAKGDTQGVIVAKRDQLLNFYAAKATTEAQAEATKIGAFFEKITKAKDDVVGKTRDLDVVKAAQAILAAYGLTSEAKGKAAVDYVAVLEKNDPAMFAAVKPSIDAALAGAKPIGELTMGELRALNEELQALWYLAKRSRQMEIDGNLLDRQDVEEELKARMQEIGIPDSMPGDVSAITPREQLALKLKTFIATARRVESWAQAMDGLTKLGSFRRFVWQPVKEAATQYHKAKGAALAQFKALLDPVADSFVREQIEVPELGYTFGKDTDGVAMSELLHAVLHTGNESNKRKMLLGRKWATENADGTLDTAKWDAFLARMVKDGKLTAKHFDAVQAVWDLMESTKPAAQKAHRDVFGRYFAEVTADKFTDPFGVERRGGYIPAMADSRIVSDMATRRLMEDENNSMQFAFPTTSKGFTKSRVEYNRPLLLDMRSLTQHIDKVLLFAHMEVPVREVRRVLTAKGVAYGLNRIEPAAFDRILTPWLNRAAKQAVETPVPGTFGSSRFWTVVRQRAGMAAMFFNVANAVQQLAGFSLAAVKVSPAKMLKATAQYTAAPKQTAEAVAAKSEFMQTRMSEQVSKMTYAIENILADPSTVNKGKRWLQRHAYFVQQAIDNVMSPIIWTAAYNQALEAGHEDKDAVRLADSAIRETQQSTAPEEVSAIEAGTPFERMFMQFAGYFNMQANLLGTEFKVLARDLGLRKGAGRGLYVLVFGFLVNAWVAEAIMQAFKGGPDDEDKDGHYLDDWLKQVFGWSLFRNAAAMVPFAGQAVNALVNSFDNKPYNDRMGVAPAISMLESSVKAGKDVVHAAEGKDVKPSSIIRDVATLITMLTGIPLSAAARPVGYLADVQEGKVHPTSAVDAARGAVTGTASPQSKH